MLFSMIDDVVYLENKVNNGLQCMASWLVLSFLLEVKNAQAICILVLMCNTDIDVLYLFF